MKRTFYAIICFVLCLSTLVSIVGCGGTEIVIPTPLPSETLATDTNSQTMYPASSQTSTDTQTQIQVPTGTQSESVTETLINTDIVTSTESEFQTEVEIETGAPTESETQTEAPTAAPTESKTETEKKTEKVDPIPGKTKTTETLRSKVYKLNMVSSYYRYVGRVKPISDGLLFDHSASTLEVQGYMTGAVDLKVSSTQGTSYFTVYIDGKRSDTRFKVSGANQTITIANFTGKYFHRISIVKQTEVDWSTSTLHSLTFKGYLVKAPAKKDLYIEFYGDSLTAGYGNIGKPGDSNAGTPPYEDATKTYAYLLSQKLDADCSILARSGVGLAPCWSECFQDRFKKYSYARSSEAFSFKGARVPDLVVIHLGANDYAHANNEDGTPTKSEFISHGKALIKFIREGYGKDIPIIWAHDPGEGRPAWITEMLNSLGGEKAGFYTVALPWSEAGAGGHPSANEHQKHANIVYNLINQKKLLK